MNLLLLQPEELADDGVVTLCDRRFNQLTQVHQVVVGDQVRVGIINGLMGQAEILQLTPDHVVLHPTCEDKPPQALPMILVLAMPRPKMLRRCLRMVAELGVKELYLINSYRVEKSFWQTPLLEPAALEENMLLGLEQAKDTLLPKIHIKKRFKPFVEDELPALLQERAGFVAHPSPDGISLARLDTPITRPSLLCIGPEGGFIPYEVEKLQGVGLGALTLGERILRVETVLPFLLGRLYF